MRMDGEMMKIRFTKHALEKFGVLRRDGILVTRARVLHILQNPDTVDYRRLPLLIAQGDFDKYRVLRVVYRHKGETMVVITFYPGRKSYYEKNQS